MTGEGAKKEGGAGFGKWAIDMAAKIRDKVIPSWDTLGTISRTLLWTLVGVTAADMVLNESKMLDAVMHALLPEGHTDLAAKSGASIAKILENHGFPVTDAQQLGPEHLQQLRDLFKMPGMTDAELERVVQDIVRTGGYTDNAGHHFKVFMTPPQTTWDNLMVRAGWDDIEQVEVTEPVPGAPRMVQEGTSVHWETGNSEHMRHESAEHAGVPAEPAHHGSAAQVEVPYEFSPQERDAFLIDDARLGGKPLSFYNQENPFTPGQPEYDSFNRCRAFLEKLPEDIWRTSNMPASNMF